MLLKQILTLNIRNDSAKQILTYIFIKTNTNDVH